MAKQPDELTAHPVAALFPMLPDDELQELAESIKARGLEHPIVLDSEGRILDGRNRYAACNLAGIEPRFVTFEGQDADGYALDVNIQRRHLSKSQRAMAVAMRFPEGERGRGKNSDARKALETSGFSADRLKRARAVLRALPETAARVLAGDVPLDEAYSAAVKHERELKDRNEKKALLREKASDLYDLVEDERLSIDDAIASLEARQSREEAEKRREWEDVMRAVESGNRYATDIHTTFNAAVLTVVQGKRAVARAKELAPEGKEVRAPSVTEDQMQMIRDAFELLVEEYESER